jgi:hypothetical protein
LIANQCSDDLEGIFPPYRQGNQRDDYNFEHERSGPYEDAADAESRYEGQHQAKTRKDVGRETSAARGAARVSLI